MKMWYQWFYLSLVYAFGGIINYLENKQIVGSVILVGITLTLGFIQFLCDKKGAKGKKVFNYISIVAIVLEIIWLIYLVFSALR